MATHTLPVGLSDGPDFALHASSNLESTRAAVRLFLHTFDRQGHWRMRGEATAVFHDACWNTIRYEINRVFGQHGVVTPDSALWELDTADAVLVVSKEYRHVLVTVTSNRVLARHLEVEACKLAFFDDMLMIEDA